MFARIFCFILLLLFSQPASAHTENAQKETENKICQKSFPWEKYIINPEDNVTEAGLGIYYNLDINNDGFTDEVTRSCGAGIPKLCTLFVEFRMGGKMVTGDIAAFSLAKIDKDFYIIQTINDSPNEQEKDQLIIERLKYMSIEEICK